MSNPTQQSTKPDLLFDISVQYWRSAALFSAIELNIFETLAGNPMTATELSTSLELPERSLTMLLEGLYSIDLLIKKDESYENSNEATAFLVRENGKYLGDTIMFNAQTVPAWGNLTQAIKDNGPGMSTTQFLGDDKDATRNFVMGMHNRAKGVARCLVHILDLSNQKNLLDVGGGPATYSVMLAEKFPNLNCTVMDLPGVLEVSRELVAGTDVKDRVTLKDGDMFTDSFGSDYDTIMFSGVLHRTEGDSTIEQFKKAHEALEPGGMLIISDLFTGAPNNGPVQAELFSLHMMLTSNAGQSLPMLKIEDYLNEAGFDMTSTIPYPPPLPHHIVTAVKR